MNEKGIKYYKCLLSTFPGTGFSSDALKRAASRNGPIAL